MNRACGRRGIRVGGRGSCSQFPLEPERPGKLGILNAVEERCITVPTRERKVNFLGGVVAMAEGAIQREGIDKGVLRAEWEARGRRSEI